MLRVYYVDGVVVAEAREQWKKAAGGGRTPAAVRVLVRVLAADLPLNFDLVIMHSCSPQWRNVMCQK